MKEMLDDKFVIRVSSTLKAAVEKRAAEQGIPTAEMVRTYLGQILRVSPETMKLMFEQGRREQEIFEQRAVELAQLARERKTLEGLIDMRKARIEATADSAG